MAIKFFKMIEDLANINTYRVTRGNSRRFAMLSARRLERQLAEAKKDDESLPPTLRDELLDKLQESIHTACKQLSAGCSNKAEDIDEIFKNLVEEIQPLKKKLVQGKKEDAEERMKIFDEASELEDASGGIALEIQTMSGKSIKVSCLPSETIDGVKTMLHKKGAPPPREQLMLVGGRMLEGESCGSTLEALDLKDGTTVTLVCIAYCEVCEKGCVCADCHGEGRYGDGCETCGTKRPDCEKCSGPCKCSSCHGQGTYGCDICGIRPPCWGGDTLVLLPDGSTKKVRDCREGDEVRTLRGTKRIARVWSRDPSLPHNIDTEVVLLDGVWITSHHPIIHGSEWVFPADIKASALWSKRRHLVPDMYNFELEGHDDTILLWGGGELVVSCTIGKYLGPRFGNGICTRRSTRCPHECAQCDAVYVEGLKHNRILSEMRWCRFPDFPQVEWTGDVSEFELAAIAKQQFEPPQLPSYCAHDIWLASPKCWNCADRDCVVAVA